MRKSRYALRLGLLMIFIFGSVIIIPNYSSFQFARPNIDEVACHFVKTESLPDVSDFPPKDNVKNIFFLETSCNSFLKGKLFIKSRQACAVESAARMNPGMDVYLLYASPGIIKDEKTQSDRLLQVLKIYPNVKILHVDIGRFIKKTPVENLWTTGKIRASKYPMVHNSDILRLLTLWKFGGIYLDLDVIVIKSLEHFPDNFAGAESEDLLGNSIMGLSRIGKGHEYVTAFMNDIRDNFNGAKWSYNGPKLITRTISRKCPEWRIKDLIEYGACEAFTIFPPHEFYLVPWQKWEWFFHKELTYILDAEIEKKSHIIHVWNKLSSNTLISKNDTHVPYLYFATQFCPKVVGELDDFF